MTVETWLLFVVTEFFLCITPGPAVLLVVSHGMGFGARSSRWSMLGILAANSCYFGLSAMGLGAILLASATLFQVIKWVGVAYLIFLGLKMLLESDTLSLTTAEQPGSRSAVSLFRQGFALQAGNPKAILFFAALLPQFIAPGTEMIWQFVLLGASSVIIEALVLVIYGMLAEQGSKLFASKNVARIQNRVSGGFLIAAAVGLATTHRP
jgi:homoserine/homoserine lactone efflux protein